MFSEGATVQRPITKYATEIGWDSISQDEALALRNGETGLFLYPVLREALLRLNAGILDESNVDDVIGRMEAVPPSIEGNEELLKWLREQQSVFVPAEGREMNLRVADLAEVSENRWHVTEEWQYTNGAYTNRADTCLLLNGIPIVLLEAKAPHHANGIDEGYTQVIRYHVETPELVTAAQLFAVTHLIHFYYGATWSLERRNLFNWKDVEPGNFERKVKAFLDRVRILETVRDYIAFIRKDGSLQKVVLRQHQVRAAEAVLRRVREEARRGLVWHTQGSGKTLTMMTVAAELLGRDEFGKPTVVMVVDRNELESQLFGNLSAYGFADVTVTTDKRDLAELLRSGYRGLLVTTIHKFDRMEPEINESPDLVVLIDEAHRTTTGDFGTYLLAAMPNATVIGFTGTPIDKTAHGAGTFKVFGGDDDRGYLDKYSIAESIEDGTTLPLHYALAPSSMRVSEEQLNEEFLELAAADGITDIEELNGVLDRAVTLRAFLKSPQRIEAVADQVARHFVENVQPLGYKAFVVAVDREACALYHAALNDRLPGVSRVVMTTQHNDPPEMKRLAMTEDEEADVRRAFREPGSDPQILIVTEKLLTGFDAPILYAMYLDKPMRDHTLLQAIARVNRPYEEAGLVRKPAGFVLDFVGMFGSLEKALAFDSDDIAGVVQNISVLKERFADLVAGAAQYLDLYAPPVDDKALERALEAFAEPESRNALRALTRELQTLYEIISPDPFLVEYLDAYARIVRLGDLVRAAFEVTGVPTSGLMRKTERLIQERIESDVDSTSLPVFEINEATLRELRESDSGDTPKILNLARGLIEGTKSRRHEQPYLRSIGDRAESVLEAFRDRQETSARALEALEAAAADYVEAEQEREASGLDLATFSAYWTLKRAGIGDAENLAAQITTSVSRFPHFRENVAQMRSLRIDLYATVLPISNPTDAAALVEALVEGMPK